jgi:hypothetical protein
MGTERGRRGLNGEALFVAAERDVDARRCRQRDVARSGLRPRTVLVTFFGRPAAAAGLEGVSPEGPVGRRQRRGRRRRAAPPLRT